MVTTFSDCSNLFCLLDDLFCLLHECKCLRAKRSDYTQTFWLIVSCFQLSSSLSLLLFDLATFVLITWNACCLPPFLIAFAIFPWLFYVHSPLLLGITWKTLWNVELPRTHFHKDKTVLKSRGIVRRYFTRLAGKVNTLPTFDLWSRTYNIWVPGDGNFRQ